MIQEICRLSKCLLVFTVLFSFPRINVHQSKAVIRQDVSVIYRRYRQQSLLGKLFKNCTVYFLLFIHQPRIKVCCSWGIHYEIQEMLLNGVSVQTRPTLGTPAICWESMIGVLFISFLPHGSDQIILRERELCRANKD